MAVKRAEGMAAKAFVLMAALLVAAPAAAAEDEIVLTLEEAFGEGGLLPSTQTYDPELPFDGSGSIDFDLGTGTLSLPDYSVTINVIVSEGDMTLDARLDVSGWTQFITSIDASGNITSTGDGTLGCTSLGGLGSQVCSSVPDTIQGWPPADGPNTPSSAVIDMQMQTITIVDNSSENLGGTNTQIFSYELVPEPSLALLNGGAIVAVAALRRRRKPRLHA